MYTSEHGQLYADSITIYKFDGNSNTKARTIYYKDNSN